MNQDTLKEKGVEIAFSGDLDALRVFVSEHPDLMTHLLIQVCNRRPLNKEVIAFLIGAGVDVNGKKESGTVALHGVASFNDVESAHLLLDAGAEVHVPGGGHFNDGTPLDFAMGFGFPKLVDLFVDHGAKIYNLELAAAVGRLDLVKDYFLSDGKLRATAAVKSLTEEVAEDAVLENARPCIQRAFMMACVHGRVDVARFLLQYDVDVNATIGFEYHGDEWAHLEKENKHNWISGSVLHHVLLRRFDDIAMLLCAKGARQTPYQREDISLSSEERKPFQGKLPVRGKLFISGAGSVPELRPRFVDSVGGLDERILTMPTSNALIQSEDVLQGWPTIPEFKDVGICELDLQDESWLKKWSWSVHWLHQMGHRNAALLHTSDRDVANSDTFCEHIYNAKGIFFTTGTASKFMATYKGTKAHQAFLDLLDRGGSIGGWSGGAMIQGDWSADTEVDSFIETLGFLPDTAILTHFLKWNMQFFVPPFIEKHPECLGIGLDERSAIVVQGDEFEVIGSSYVALYDYNKVLLPDGKFYLIAPGDRFNLTTREVIGEPKTYLKQLVNRKWSEI